MGRRPNRAAGLLLLFLVSVSAADTINADQSNYQQLIGTLQPGDTLILAPGDYPDLLNIRDVHGTPSAWITIKGPDTGPQPRFLGKTNVCCNTVEIRTGSYFALENLTIDGRDVDGIFAINAGGSDTHHVRIENCTIVGHGGHQQTVGISTKAPTWGWIVRRNTIVAAGTGCYFGDSTGNDPFVGGLIEYNLFLDSKGYNMQIKHQNSRTLVSGMPTSTQRTIIRHNVFIKGSLPNEDGARPNLLLGHFPSSGVGASDFYEIYGNFFYHNHRESLLQAEGRVSIHDNVFVDAIDDAIFLSDHNDTLKTAYVYNNTFYEVDTAINFSSPARQDHSVVGNLVFGRRGVAGNFTNASSNIVDSVANAPNYVANPSLNLSTMDFYPLAGQSEGPALDLSLFNSDVDYDRDFNGDSKGAMTFRGAYAGAGANPGWQLDQVIKGDSGGSAPPPPGPSPPPPAPPPPGGTGTTGSSSNGGTGAAFWLLGFVALLFVRRRH